jgi:hypothetical protein
MENHLNDKNRILKEWDDLSSYEADSNKSEIGTKYMTKNRYSNILPCKKYIFLKLNYRTNNE